MTFERIMGIEVSDEEMYQKYRQAMLPILKNYGGHFTYDFKIEEVLISKTQAPINRVFTIEFPSSEVMDTFFSDAEYIDVKKRYFESSVDSVTEISLHEVKA